MDPDERLRLRCQCRSQGVDCTVRATAEDMLCTVCRTRCNAAIKHDGDDWRHLQVTMAAFSFAAGMD